MILDFKRFRQIFEHAPLGIFLTTREGYFVDLNERLALILGYHSVKEIKAQVKNVATDLYADADDRNSIIDHIDAGKDVIDKDVSFKKKDGQIIFVRIFISKFSETKNGKAQFIGMVEDISEKKALEKKLQEHENLLASIVDCLPFELWVINRDGEILSQSGFSQKRWGSYVGKNIQVFPRQDYWKLDQYIHRAWAGEHLDIEKEFNLEGKTLYSRMFFTPLFDGDQIKGVIVISLNQTEKVQAQKRVLEIQQFLETVLNGIPVRVFWKNRKQEFIGANAAFLKDFELPSEAALIGKSDYDLLPSADCDLYRNLFNEVINEQTSILNQKMWLNIPGRGEMFIIASFIPHFSKADNSVEGIFACYQDITLIKKMEEELQMHQKELEKLVEIRTWELDHLNEELINSNEELKTLNETLSAQKSELGQTLDQLKKTQNKLIQSEKMASLGILSAGIAHEINNPLNFISSGTQGIDIMIHKMNALFLELNRGKTIQDEEKSDKLKEHFEDVQQMIASMHKGVERTADIVKGLRVFSRMDPEEKNLSDVHELIEVALTILKNKYKNHVRIIRQFGTLPNIKCFPGKLSQVFLNLLMNAIQSIKESGMVEITTNLIEEGKQIQIVIVDNGSGIPDEIKNKIFDPFFTTKSVNEGVGMGLSIVHSLIAMHKGEISFESKLNKGTKFRISLPVD